MISREIQYTLDNFSNRVEIFKKINDPVAKTYLNLLQYLVPDRTEDALIFEAFIDEENIEENLDFLDIPFQTE